MYLISGITLKKACLGEGSNSLYGNCTTEQCEILSLFMYVLLGFLAVGMVVMVMSLLMVDDKWKDNKVENGVDDRYDFVVGDDDDEQSSDDEEDDNEGGDSDDIDNYNADDDDGDDGDENEEDGESNDDIIKSK